LPKHILKHRLIGGIGVFTGKAGNNQDGLFPARVKSQLGPQVLAILFQDVKGGNITPVL
jgi:hypothetical protein